LKDKIQSRTPIVKEMQSEVRNIYSSKNNNSSFDDMSRSNNDLHFDKNSMDIEELDRFVSMKQQQPPNIYTPTSKSSSRIRPPIGGILHQVSAKTIQHHNSVESEHASTNDSPQVKDNNDTIYPPTGIPQNSIIIIIEAYYNITQQSHWYKERYSRQDSFG